MYVSKYHCAAFEWHFACLRYFSRWDLTRRFCRWDCTNAIPRDILTYRCFRMFFGIYILRTYIHAHITLFMRICVLSNLPQSAYALRRSFVCGLLRWRHRRLWWSLTQPLKFKIIFHMCCTNLFTARCQTHIHISIHDYAPDSVPDFPTLSGVNHFIVLFAARMHIPVEECRRARYCIMC